MGDIFDGENTIGGLLWILVEVAALNWLLIELFQIDLVTKIFGAGTQTASFAYIALGTFGLLSLLGSLGLYDVEEVLP